MNRSCANKVTCLPCGDAPLANLSSEAPDIQVFRTTAWVKLIPPLGTDFTGFSCQATAASTQSAALAALEAEVQAVLCASSSWLYPAFTPALQPSAPVPPPVAPHGGRHIPFATNTAQQGEATCADGSPYFYDVPPGLFVGPNLAVANAAAISYGNRQAILHLLCLGNIPLLTCAGANYSASISATSAFLAVAPQTNFWQIVSGSLPPGLVFHGGALTGNPTITGIPTTPGDYDFVVNVTLPNGDTNSKEYFLVVAGITNANNLPAATIGSAYSAVLTAVGFNNPIYSVSDIPLPDGLALSSNGTISGTPASDAASGTFTVFVRDSVTGFECSQQVTLTVKHGGINFNNLVWNAPPDQNFANGNGSVSGVSNVGNSFSATVSVPQTPTSPFPNNASYQNTGTFTYNGPAVNCSLNLSTPFVFCAGQQVIVKINGAPVVNANTAGTFPFTVPDSTVTPSVIAVQFGVNSDPPNNGCGNGTFTGSCAGNVTPAF